MDIGIGLPNAVRGVDRRGIVDWARRAEEAGFSSLGTIDRIAYPNYESLISLAAAAAVTERIRLVTDILIAPLRTNTALFAKQAATIDSLSGGRLVLGLAVGGRPDDYELSHADFHTRGRVFERQLAELNEIWAGDAIGPDPASGKPADGADRRQQRAHVPPRRRVRRRVDAGRRHAGPVRRGARQDARRLESGRPRRVSRGRWCCSTSHSAMTPPVRRSARSATTTSFLGDYASRVVESAAKDADTIKGYLAAFEQAGADEVICFPASADPAQVGLLAEAVGL